MIFVALLRGINVGGKNTISMDKLKESFIKSGMQSVSTYINSGNIIFTDTIHTKKELEELLEAAIAEDFSLEIKVLVRTLPDFELLMKFLPTRFTNDDQRKSDVLFLWEEIDGNALTEKLTLREGIDELIPVPGALIWSVDRAMVSKSGMMKLVGSAEYKKMTIRNVNTVRKLHSLMSEQKDEPSTEEIPD